MCLMPIIVCVDFLVTHCFKWKLNFFHNNIAQKYFFGGPLFLLVLFSLPITLTASLELRLFRYSNYSELYSFSLSASVLIIIGALWLLIVVLI